MNTLTPQELKAKIDAHAAVTIIDVQPHEAYVHRHIPGAVHVEGYAVPAKDALLVVYGEFDELGKGAAAAEALTGQGFTNVHRLQGGMMGWMEAGYMVEGGAES